MKEAHEAAPDNRLSAASFTGGFAPFTLVASYSRPEPSER